MAESVASTGWVEKPDSMGVWVERMKIGKEFRYAVVKIASADELFLFNAPRIAPDPTQYSQAYFKIDG